VEQKQTQTQNKKNQSTVAKEKVVEQKQTQTQSKKNEKSGKDKE